MNLGDNFPLYPIVILQNTEDIPNSDLLQGYSWFSSITTHKEMENLVTSLKGLLKNLCISPQRLGWIAALTKCYLN